MSNKDFTKFIKQYGFKTRVHFSEVSGVPITTVKKWGTIRSDSNKEGTARIPTYVNNFCLLYQENNALKKEVEELKKD